MVRLKICGWTIYCVLAFLAGAELCAQSTTVAFIGDVQRTGQIELFRENNEVERRELMKKLGNEQIQSLILLGDMTFWGISLADWDYFDEIVRPLRDRNIPMYPVLGNHEYLIDADVAIKSMKQRFPEFVDMWYSKTIDSIGYIFLNTNTQDLGQVLMREQYGWYITRLRELEADSAVRFIVVCGHHPPFTNSSRVDPEATLEKYFVPWFTRSKKGAFWFSGHCHSYERFIVDGKQFIISGGGGGPRQHLLSGDDAPFHDEFPGPVIRDLHYCLMSRRGNVLTVRMVPLHESPEALSDEASVTAP